MATFEGTYITARATAEKLATPRTLRTILEDVLGVTFPTGGRLATAITVYNESDTALKSSHLSVFTTHYMTYAPSEKRQIVIGGDRVPLDEVYFNVGADDKVFAVECVVQ